MINLRDYQSKAIELIDAEFSKGNKRVIYKANTGSGKTEVMCFLAKRCVEWNYPCLVVIRRREIVKNMSKRLDRYEIDHSVHMAGNIRYDSRKPIQLASIDTLIARKKYPFKDASCLILIDESHKDYSSIFREYPEHYIVGFTATPYGDNSSYQAVVNPIEGFELRDAGHLVPEKIFCPNIIDVTGIKLRAGEFDKKELNKVVTQSAIVGDIVEDWKKYGQGRPTICFAVSVEHSMQLTQRFIDSGVLAVHCDANSPEKVRDSVSIGLLNGTIEVVCNVDIFSTGWDCPPVSCILLARPTNSLIWYLQAIGRGLRSFTGKTNCIVIDSAGNVFRHGGPYRLRDVSLEKPKKKAPKSTVSMTTCEQCILVYDPDLYDRCPECGHVSVKKARGINEQAGTLVEYVESQAALHAIKLETIKRKFRQLDYFRRNKNLTKAWLSTAMSNQFSQEDIKQALGLSLEPSHRLPL